MNASTIIYLFLLLAFLLLFVVKLLRKDSERVKSYNNELRKKSAATDKYSTPQKPPLSLKGTQNSTQAHDATKKKDIYFKPIFKDSPPNESYIERNISKKEICFYHFTDPRNITSIKKYGLLSWQELINKHILHYPASNDLSRSLDLRYNLQDYVRLCLNQNHPMFNAALFYGRVNNLVWLYIKKEVLQLSDIYYCDDNATSNRAIINRNKETALNSKSMQAEILVRNRIDQKYIIFPDEIKQGFTTSIGESNDDLPF